MGGETCHFTKTCEYIRDTDRACMDTGFCEHQSSRAGSIGYCSSCHMLIKSSNDLSPLGPMHILICTDCADDPCNILARKYR